MRKIIYFFLFLLCLTFVSADYYAGEEVLIKSFDNCNEVIINVTGSLPIEEDEYWLNCNKTDINFWECECVDNKFNLILDTNPNTINNYTFLINYEYEIITPSSPSGDTGGNGGSTRRNVGVPDFEYCFFDSDCEEGYLCEWVEGKWYKQCQKVEIEEDIEDEVKGEVTTEWGDEVEEKKSKIIVWILSIIAIIVLGVITFFVVRKR